MTLTVTSECGRSGPAVEDRDDREGARDGLVGEPIGRGDRTQERGHPFGAAQAIDHAHRDLPRQSVIDPDGCGDRIGNGREQHSRGYRPDRAPERQTRNHGHAADQHRSGIERKPENNREYVVPSHSLQLRRDRLDAELLDSLGLMIPPADLFLDFRDRMHCCSPWNLSNSNCSNNHAISMICLNNRQSAQ